MDFSKLGYLSPITPDLLATAVSGYLPPEKRATTPDWFEHSIVNATKEINGICALQPIRLQHGMGLADSYALHDYLDYFAQSHRARLPIPVTSWEALDTHSSDPDDRVRLAWQAVFRHYNRLAISFLSPVFEANSATEDGIRLVWLLEKANHTVEAMQVLQRAAEAGQTSAMRDLSRRLMRDDNYTDGVTWLRSAAKLGDPEAMYLLGSFPRLRTVSILETGFWLEKAAESGNVTAIRQMACMAEDFDVEEAIDWLRRGADANEGNTMLDLIKLLEKNGRRKESNEWIERLVEARQLHMMWSLSQWLESENRIEEDESWLRRSLADTGEITVAHVLASLLDRTGRTSAAVTVWRKIIESKKLNTMSTITAKSVAKLIHKAGQAAEAESWLRKSAQDNSPHAALILVALKDIDDAEDLLRTAVHLGNLGAMRALTELLECEGRIDEAEKMLRVEIELSELFECMRLLTDFMNRTGRSDEAAKLEQFGIEPGGNTAKPW